MSCSIVIPLGTFLAYDNSIDFLSTYLKVHYQSGTSENPFYFKNPYCNIPVIVSKDLPKINHFLF